MITKVREKKEKHIWSVQILNELLKNASMYEYENTGTGPQAVTSHKEDGETKPYQIIDGGDATFASEIFDQPIPLDVPSTDPAKTGQRNNEKENNGKGKDEKEKKKKSCSMIDKIDWPTQHKLIFSLFFFFFIDRKREGYEDY